MEHVLVVLGDQDARMDPGDADEPERRSFPVNDTWAWEARADANYRLPWDINTSTATCGPRRGRKDRGRRPSPTPRLLQGTVTLRMEEFGAQAGPCCACHQPARVEEVQSPCERYAVDVNFSVFNLINSSAPVAISYLSGTFGRVTDILRTPSCAYRGAIQLLAQRRVCYI